MWLYYNAMLYKVIICSKYDADCESTLQKLYTVTSNPHITVLSVNMQPVPICASLANNNGYVKLHIRWAGYLPS